jgi:antitoxin component of RelBE/YafQ-DinJ toxin-antitoxin module
MFYNVDQLGVPMKTNVIRARVPDHLKREFEAAIGPRGLNVSLAIRMLMEQYVAGEKEMKRRHAETLEAIEDVASRRTVSGERVLDWLAGWGTDSETGAP